MKSVISIILVATCLAIPSLAREAQVTRLDNGLQIVLLENHSVPMIAANMVINVGARDETWETWGAAHFLEHLLFNGTAGRTQEQIYAAFDSLGAYDNAHTGSNYVDFMLLVSQNNFLASLDVMNDMIFNSTLPEDKFEKERGIVCEEIARGQAMGDEGDKEVREVLFGDSPLSREVLGTVASITALKRDDVLDFYHRWYVPNNMLLFITGDFTADSLLPALQAKLSLFQPHDLPKRQLIPSPDFSILGKRGIIRRASSGDDRELVMAVAAPRPGDPDYPAFLVASSTLESRLADFLPSGVTASGETILDPDLAIYLLTLRLPQDDADAETVKKTVAQTIHGLIKHPPSSADIARFALKYRADRVFDAERLHQFGIVNSTYWALAGWDEFASWPDRLDKIAPSDVAGCAQKWLLDAPAGWFLLEPMPKAGTSMAGSDSIFTVKEAIPGGPIIICHRDPSAAVFAIHVLVKDRFLWDKQFGAGSVDLLHEYMAAVAEDPSSAEGKLVADLAANLKCADDPTIPYDNYYTVADYSFIRLEMLPDRWQDGIRLIGDLLHHPISDKQLAAARDKSSRAAGSVGRSSVAAGSKYLVKKLLPGSPASAGVYGDVTGISAAKLEDLRRLCFNPANLIISVSGPITPAQVITLIGAIFKPDGVATPASQQPPPFEGVSGFAAFSDTVNMGSPQGAVIMGKIVAPINPGDKAALGLANSYLNDQLGMQLREKQGLAYSLGSSLMIRRAADGHLWGYWEMSIGTRPANIATACDGLKSVAAQVSSHEFTDAEITKLSAVGTRGTAMRQMSRIGQAYALGVAEYYYHNPAESGQTMEAAPPTPHDVTEAAKRYLSPDGLSVVIVK